MIITDQAYLRADGRKGIRNHVVVAYLVECAHHVAREIVYPYRERGVHLIGFGGCYPNDYAASMMRTLCTHPNVGGVILLSLGCESFNRNALREAIVASSRPVETLVIQQSGGTRKTIEQGRTLMEDMLAKVAQVPRAPLHINEFIVGTVCGGSDATSGITANPGIGRAFDLLVEQKAGCIFEETGELIGCEDIMTARAATPALAGILRDSVTKAAKYYSVLGHGSFAPGNAEGGLSTIEEKSMGAYAKSGASRISGLLKPGRDRRTHRLRLARHFVFHGTRFGGWLGDFARHQSLRQSRNISSHERGHGRGRGKNPRRPRVARRSGPGNSRPVVGRCARRADQIRRTRPSGICSHLQIV
jgi:altronate hydrolase